MSDYLVPPKHVPMVTTWRGRRLEELSREELIQACTQMGRQLEIAQKQHNDTLDLWAGFRGASHV